MKSILIVLYFIFSVVAIPVNAKDEQERIGAKQVNISNYKQFVFQLNKDLPVGTPVQDVKSYLSENKIKYSDVPHEGSLYVMLKKIDSSFFVFTTDLWIRIYFSEKDGLSEIKCDLIETAF